MIHYILQIIAFQLLFLVVYDLFLKNETFFTWNRIYLLATPLLSFILPLVKIDLIRQNIPEQFMVQLPAVIVGGNKTSVLASESLESVFVTSSSLLSVYEMVQWVWLLGIFVCLFIFANKLYRITKLKQLGSRANIDNLSVIILPETDVAFSFFNTIYLGAKLSEAQRSKILLHEKIHIQQRHSLDLLFFELLRIILWFNPLIYVFQNKMMLLQEFTADAEVASRQGKNSYYEDMLSTIFNTESISFINTFFNHSLIKKRILMLQKAKSKKIFQLKYLLLIPVVCAMLIYTSCSEEKTDVNANLVSETDTEVMDKINELAEAIMKKGNLSDEEVRALEFLATEAKPGDKIYTSVQEYLDDPITTDLSFANIEQPPIFPGCEGLSGKEAKKCFTQKISAFIGENFKIENLNDTDISGKQKIMTTFVIDKEGSVIVKDIQANHPDLEAEALHTLGQLPKMIPGEHKGKKVAVKYALPIVFIVNE